jgi:hypothetical protein
MSSVLFLRRWLTLHGVPWSLTDSEEQLKLLQGKVQGVVHVSSVSATGPLTRPSPPTRDQRILRNMYELRTSTMDNASQTDLDALYTRPRVVDASCAASLETDREGELVVKLREFEQMKTEVLRLKSSLAKSEGDLTALRAKLVHREEENLHLRDRLMFVELSTDVSGHTDTMTAVNELKDLLLSSSVLQPPPVPPASTDPQPPESLRKTVVLKKTSEILINIGWLSGLDKPSVFGYEYYVEVSVYLVHQTASLLGMVRTLDRAATGQGRVTWDSSLTMSLNVTDVDKLSLKVVLWSRTTDTRPVLCREGSFAFKLEQFDHRREFRVKPEPGLPAGKRERRLVMVLGPVMLTLKE